MDDSDASTISESGEVLEGSVASAAASGSSAPEFIRLPECEIMAHNEPDGLLAEAWKMLREEEDQAISHGSSISEPIQQTQMGHITMDYQLEPGHVESWQTGPFSHLF